MWYKENYGCVSQTARVLGVSRYAVAYHWGCWGRKPKHTYLPRNDEEEMKLLKVEKYLVEQKILKGAFDEEHPVEEGRDLREIFRRIYGVYPELIK